MEVQAVQACQTLVHLILLEVLKVMVITLLQEVVAGAVVQETVAI
jgi:hypothetical protein